MGSSDLTLTLVRHAHAEWPHYRGRDFDRPLTPRGLQEAQATAIAIRERIEPPELLLASAALRTRQTAGIIARTLALPDCSVRYSDTLFNATLAILEAELRRSAANCLRVLLLAHNPGISEFARQLGGDQTASFRPAHWQVFTLPR